MRLIDTVTDLPCCLLRCFDCAAIYAACDCTSFPRPRNRHPVGSGREDQEIESHRSFGPVSSRRCPSCWRKHSFACPQCRSTNALKSCLANEVEMEVDSDDPSTEKNSPCDEPKKLIDSLTNH